MALSSTTPSEWSEEPRDDLSVFEASVLLGELVRRDAIPIEVAAAIHLDKALYTEGQAIEIFGAEEADEETQTEIDTVELEEARAELMSGRRGEALIHLERALGGDFVGRLAVA